MVVDAFIEHSNVTLIDGDVVIGAFESVQLDAATSSEAHSSGGNEFGGGTSLGASGIIATNILNSAADATIMDSDIDTALSSTGLVSVTASNDLASLDADVINGVTSGAEGMGDVGV